MWMSHFYGYLQGCRGQATRCGSKDSGINAQIQSWDNKVVVYLNSQDNGKDELNISIPDGLKTYINGAEMLTWCVKKICEHYEISKDKLEDLIASLKI